MLDRVGLLLVFWKVLRLGLMLGPATEAARPVLRTTPLSKPKAEVPPLKMPAAELDPRNWALEKLTLLPTIVCTRLAGVAAVRLVTLTAATQRSSSASRRGRYRGVRGAAARVR